MSASPPIWNASRETSLEVYLLGLVDFDACQHLEALLGAEIGGRNDGQGVVLVCEHPPLITIGREGSQAHLLCSRDELAAREIEVRWMNRGGGCVVHTPGQLAVYPIIPLERRGLGLLSYRTRLEQAIVAMCGDLRIPARRENARAGVWCRGGRVAQIGVAVRSWVSSQGAFVDVAPQVDPRRLVCDETGRVTSLCAERRMPVSMASVRESLVRRLAESLEYDRYHLYTGHPRLRRTRRVVAYA